MHDYIARNVKEQLVSAVRDRNVLETESAIRVFEKALGWAKTIGYILALVVAILAGLGIWKASDWWSSVSAAKQAVVDTSKGAQIQINGTAATASQTIVGISKEASRQSEELKKTALQTKAEMVREATSLRASIDTSRSQLQAAGKLAPEMAAMQQQLARATADIQAQQKVISSSEDFVKSVFSTHMVEYFHVGQSPENLYSVLPPPPGGNRTVVFLVLSAAPIPQTLQLQFQIYTQPPNSYFTVHNLVIFFWGQPPGNLKTQQLSASYFPDKTDKDLVHSLTQRDGRAFADDEPLPKFNQPDPDFKGNKWLKVQDGEITLK